MTRARKIWIGVGLLAVFSTAFFVVVAKPREQFSDTIPFLKGLRPDDTSSFRFDGTVTLHPMMLEQSKFILPRSLPEIAELAKRDLKPISTGASSYPSKDPTTYNYGFDLKKWGQGLTVTISKIDENRTVVFVNSAREETWMDGVRQWFTKIVGPKERLHH